MVRALGFVGVCIVLSGLLVNTYLAVVARTVSPAEYADFGAFWSIALLVGFGAFLPVEQELARLGPGKALRSAAYVALGIAAVEALAALAVSPALVTLCFVSAGQFLVRGALIGSGRLRWHGALLVVDTALRVLFALVAAWLGATTSAQFEWTLVAAIALAHLPLLPGVLRRGGAEVSTPAVARAVAPLLAGSICAQLLLNGIPALTAAIATEGERAQAGVFLAAFLLARVPLFVAVPLQTALLPALKGNEVVAVVRCAAALAVAAVAGVLTAFTIGPWLVRLVFGPGYVVSTVDLSLIVLGVVAHLGLIVTTQALVARASHNRVAVCWFAGVLAAAVAFILIPDLLLRAELAFLAGSLVGWLIGVRLLITSRQESELCSTTSSSP